MGVRRSTAASVIGCAAVLSPLLVPLAGPASGQDCAQPYSPVFVQRTYSTLEAAPRLDAAPVTIPTLDHGLAGGVWSAGHPTFPDFDGDGQTDWYPFSKEGEPTITRPTGALKLAHAGLNLAVTFAGNLDGEPGQEIWVYDTLSRAERSQGDLRHVGDFSAWVVPYATPAGRYDPADVGIRVPGRNNIPRPIPDWTGDGVDDVLVIRGTPQHPTTDVLSGAEIMAAGIPGDVSDLKPVVTIPGAAKVLADFGGAQPAIVTTDSSDRIDQSFIVRVFDGGTTTEFTDAPFPFPGVSGPGGDITALRGPDSRFVRSERSSRSGAIAWWWSLDRPCSPLSAGAGGTGAPTPASPTVGTPRLTG